MFRQSILALVLWGIAASVFALQERHLIVIRHGESEHNIKGTYNSDPHHPHYVPSHLTDTGKKQAKQAAELLLTYGFDDRSISAVIVSPLPRARETAQIIANMGVFSASKIHSDARLIENRAGDREGQRAADYSTGESWLISPEEAKSYRAESSQEVHQRMFSIYDSLEEKYPEGHIIFITHGLPAMELIDGIGKTKVRLKTGQVYLLPIVKRRYALA